MSRSTVVEVTALPPQLVVEQQCQSVCASAMQASAQLGRRSSREVNASLQLAGSSSSPDLAATAAAGAAAAAAGGGGGGSGPSSSRSSSESINSKQRRTSEYLCEWQLHCQPSNALIKDVSIEAVQQLKCF
jgi:hypothetical protein